MDLNHSFTVPASMAETWEAFEDIESVAACFPGAVVTEVNGDDFKGNCKVKLGPIALTYSGSGTFTSRDESAGRFVVEAKGKDKRGNGTAGATVTAQLTDQGDSTKVDVHTDLAITGKPAQFGRGVMQEVSDKLLQQFVTCLQSKVGAPPEPAAEEAAAPAGAADSFAEAPASAEEGTTDRAAADRESVAAASFDGSRRAPSSAYSGVSAGSSAGSSGGSSAAASSGGDNALDLGATVLPVLAKAYWKQAVGALVILLVLRKLLRRK